MLFPATNITAIVSPNALPIPSKKEARIPDFAYCTLVLKIVCILVAPNAKDPSTTAFGTACKEETDRDTTVGNTISAKIMDALNNVEPLFNIKIFCTIGTIIVNPKNPYTTLGIADKISTTNKTNCPIFLGAISLIKTAVYNPTGIPIRTAANVVNILASIKGKIPYFPDVGDHCVPVINEIMFTSLNRGKAFINVKNKVIWFFIYIFLIYWIIV